MTRKWYATLRHPKMYPHTKFGIPTSKNIGDMDRTRKRDGRTDGRTDGLTDGRTVRLLYASQSSFGGIKKNKYVLINSCPETAIQSVWNSKISINNKCCFHLKRTDNSCIMLREINYLFGNIIFNFQLGLKSALLACYLDKKWPLSLSPRVQKCPLSLVSHA